RLVGPDVCLEYEVAGVYVHERVGVRTVGGQHVFERQFRLEQVPKPLCLVLGRRPISAGGRMTVLLSADSINGKPIAKLDEVAGGLHVVRVSPSVRPVQFRVALALDGPARTWDMKTETPPTARWPAALTTRATLSNTTGAVVVVDNIPLPLDNPWKRNIRLADIAFFR